MLWHSALSQGSGGFWEKSHLFSDVSVACLNFSVSEFSSFDSYYCFLWLNVAKLWHLQIPEILRAEKSRQANWCPLQVIIDWIPDYFSIFRESSCCCSKSWNFFLENKGIVVYHKEFLISEINMIFSNTLILDRYMRF